MRIPFREDDWRRTVRVPSRVVVFFTRQLATMIQTAIPIVPALHSLSEQADDPTFEKVLKEVCRHVETGQSFSHSLSLFPRVFPRLYHTMVAVGESTGQMDESLDILAGWLERDQMFRSRVKSALVYPAFILALSLTLTVALFHSVLPSFLKIFDQLVIELPAPTRVLIVLSGAARNPTVWLVAAFLLLVVWGRLRRYTKTKVGSIRIFRVLSVVPVLGNILTASSTSRYACAMAALLENGVNLTKALPLAALASESPLLKLDSADLAWNMTNGASLTEHMRNEPDIYDDILVQLVAVGEETSELAGMYGYAARYYDMETTNALDAFSAAIEPVLLCLVAGIVGFIMLGLFLPMYSYLSQI